MPFTTRQKLFVYIGDDGGPQAVWITVPVIDEMLREGTMVPCDLTNTQVASVIALVASKLP